MNDVHVGIDLGTSSVKTVLLDSRGTLLVTAQEPYPVARDLPGWAEQDPELWWRAVATSIRRALSSAVGARPVSVGLAGQMHGGVLLDAANRPLRPAIIWSDSRTGAIVDRWRAEIGDAETRATCGIPAATGMLGVSLVWVRDNEPEVWSRLAHVVSPKDFIRLRLTGTLALDPTDAAATLLFDVHTGRPASRILDRVGIPESILPPTIASTAIAGTVTSVAGDATGLRAGIPVAAGGGDQAMAALALGIDSPRRAAIAISSGGTAFTVARDSRAVPAEVHVLASAEPDQHLAMGVVLAAGLAIDWAAQTILGVDRDGLPALMAEAAATPAGAAGALALPHLGGTRTPLVYPWPLGAVVGLGFEHGPAHLIRALVEGVAVSLVGSLAAVADPHEPLEEIVISGGGARFDIWREALADISGIPVTVSSDLEHPAIGAALAGSRASEVPVSFDPTARVLGRIEPRAEYSDLYTDLARRHRGLESFLTTEKGRQS